MADKRTGVSRRDVLRGAGAAALIGAVSGVDAQERAGRLARVGPGAAPIKLTVNGKPTVLEVEPRVTLLDALRDRAGLTGTKRICDRGACGGCTVWVDGKTVNSCLMLAVDAAGRAVTTIEGLARNGKLHPVQAAFVKHDALQCGFCTPGMVMSCAALVGSNKNPTQAEIREAVSGNLCRCGVYPHVFAAVEEAAR
ncbi:MAG: (2Fe-2S)-binding protein [Planctomycetota bacterium]|jgi:aerobic-type carbon monoxide dehydrogenase small subunit (CoxS/CutS family)